MRIRTWPGEGLGIGRSSSLKLVLAGPSAFRTEAFMVVIVDAVGMRIERLRIKRLECVRMILVLTIFHDCLLSTHLYSFCKMALFTEEYQISVVISRLVFL